ncbi:MAG: DUF6361 family protein [Terriglobia bacterium]
MEPAFGWTLLSPEAIRRAEARLREDTMGVRDEIGFLLLHQAYADRFFPGTSVQQTRLRYALFVPWIYEKVAAVNPKKPNRRTIESLILEEEVKLTGRLLDSGEFDGVIGRRVYPQRRASSQPATMVYWSAMGAWGLLRRLAYDSVPSRASVHRILSRSSHGVRLHDDDDIPIEETYSLFVDLPKPPESWRNATEPLTFALSPGERSFMRRQLLTTRRFETTAPSLLARLADNLDPIAAALPWDRRVSALADADDQLALRRACHVASLAAIGRAVYASLVEKLRDVRDHVPTSDLHRAKLAEVIEEHRAKAVGVEIPAVLEDAAHLPGAFVRVLKETQGWLIKPDDPETLLESYSLAEISRKGGRARLAPTPLGRQRREEWNNEEHPVAQPLHYRWGIVRRLLRDLENHD